MPCLLVLRLALTFILCHRIAHGGAEQLPSTLTSLLQPCSGDVIQQSCVWAQQPTAPHPLKVASPWSESGGLPVVLVSGSQDKGGAPVPGFSLALQRLVIANVTLAAPDAAGVPKLWPLDMFAAPGTNLSMADVRLVVGDGDFQQYLKFFPASLEGYHTDGHSFMHIAAWADKSTSLKSVTVISGACRPGSAAAYVQTSASLAAVAAAKEGGCDVRTVDNTTLIPTLVKDGGVATTQPLLVLIISNVTLGAGLKAGAIDIRRPVVMAGLYSVPTSVDLGMVVNQLNVTANYSRIYWQSLFVENAGPGDAVASIVAPPYSAAVSANLYAMYCNRTTHCLNLYNTTTVLASQEEMDYITFMYSMYNSPLPNMRQHTDFYHTELKCTVLDMGPGPNGYGLTLYNMSCSAWELYNSVFTTQPVVSVAPRLPFPAGMPLIRQATQAAPWVQAVGDCSSLQAAMLAPSEENRLHVWMLLADVSINPPHDPKCWQQRDVKHPTQIYGQRNEPLAPPELMQGAAQPKLLQGAAASAAERPDAAGHFDVYSFGFNFMRSALQLPTTAQGKYLQIQNVTLLQLPQGPDASKAAGMRAGPGGDGPTPPDVWTLLLWSVNRTQAENTVFIADAQLMLPQPEYDFVAETARTSSSFVVQLAGTVGLAFTSTSVVGNAVRVSALQGPGIAGNNIWLLPDPTAAGSMPEPYVWPLAVTAAPTSSRFASSGPSDSQQTAIKAAVGASIGGAVLLLLLGLCCWWGHRRHQRKLQRYSAAAYKPGSSESCEGSDSMKPPGSSGGAVPRQSPGGHILSIDVGGVADNMLHTAKLPTSSVLQPGSSCQDVGFLRSAASASAGGCSMSGSSGIAGARSVESEPIGNTVASGLQRWKAAISTTTMQLMERRMNPVQTAPHSSLSSSSGRQESAACGVAPAAAAGSDRVSSRRSVQSFAAVEPAAASQTTSLQLQGLLGQGSFGCVYLGIWHGKRVAVKVMQLPANALLGPQDEQLDSEQQGGLSLQEQQRRRRARQRQQNSAPHMAIIETVVSSTMSHPNVVQVYTYMLNPLTVESDAGGDQGQQEVEAAPAAASPGIHGNVSGWELKLVMEYCDRGTLRDALDRKTLLRGTGAAFLQPVLVLSLAHDIAAALLHLHSEGVVHGDLKAANVMLTKGGEDPGGVWGATVGYKVTAKVADFGLAMPLDPKDTHATMAARGTPTHMSPELFMAGHVSKASDVYAYGILLYEIITGQRAYAGVPIPLLPHEVARQGLRPTWPPNLPSGCKDLRRLAEACWAQLPHDRPSLHDIFSFLEACQSGRPLPALRVQQQQQQQQEQQQGQAAVVQEQHPQQSLQQEQQQVPAQQQQVPPTAATVGQSAGPGKGLSWSEVTYAKGQELVADVWQNQ